MKIISPFLNKISWKLGLSAPLRILYLSCHSILEHDEVSLLREIGHHVFSPGDYVDEQNPGRPSLRSRLRQPSPAELEDHRAFNLFGKQGPANKNELTRDFVDRFDVIIVMHLPHWITLNWSVMKHKKVIWRTIGQSSIHIERQLAPYRLEGLKIIRFSPQERFLPEYLGSDALIRFYKDPEEYGDWVGDIASVMTVAQHMPQRADACHFDVFQKVIKPFPAQLFGPGNEAAGPISLGEIPYSNLKKALRKNRCYFYTGTFPASYTLSFIEPWMTGIPVVALGPKLMHDRFPDEHLYEIPNLITHGEDGFYADSIEDLQEIIRSLIDDYDLAKRISFKGRSAAIRYFGKETIKAQWVGFLRNLG
jgi:hypothetical protein